MSKVKSEVTAFFNNQKPSSAIATPAAPPNAFKSIFDVQKLDSIEEMAIEQILEENSKNSIANEKLLKDVVELKHITAEIKGIRKQAILLLGERVFKAREILKNYGDGRGAFTRWLQLTFSSRVTGYNALSYFEFHQSLPEEKLRIQLKQMPYKAAYALAARDGDFNIKTEILNECFQLKVEDILLIIREKLPTSADYRKRIKDSNASLISSIVLATKKLLLKKSYLTPEDKEDLRKISENIKCLMD